MKAAGRCEFSALHWLAGGRTVSYRGFLAQDRMSASKEARRLILEQKEGRRCRPFSVLNDAHFLCINLL